VERIRRLLSGDARDGSRRFTPPGVPLAAGHVVVAARSLLTADRSCSGLTFEPEI
jgi:hypothetical protein